MAGPSEKFLKFLDALDQEDAEEAKPIGRSPSGTPQTRSMVDSAQNAARVQSELDDEENRPFSDKLASTLLGFGSGGAGSFSDEIGAGVKYAQDNPLAAASLLTPMGPAVLANAGNFMPGGEQRRKDYLSMEELAQENDPGLFGSGQLGGTAAQTIATLPISIGNGVTGAVKTGGAMGSIFGAASGEGEERGANALFGGATGALTGGLLGKGLRKLGDVLPDINLKAPEGLKLPFGSRLQFGKRPNQVSPEMIESYTDVPPVPDEKALTDDDIWQKIGSKEVAPYQREQGFGSKANSSEAEGFKFFTDTLNDPSVKRASSSGNFYQLADPDTNPMFTRSFSQPGKVLNMDEILADANQSDKLWPRIQPGEEMPTPRRGNTISLSGESTPNMKPKQQETISTLEGDTVTGTRAPDEILPSEETLTGTDPRISQTLTGQIMQPPRKLPPTVPTSRQLPEQASPSPTEPPADPLAAMRAEIVDPNWGKTPGEAQALEQWQQVLDRLNAIYGPKAPPKADYMAMVNKGNNKPGQARAIQRKQEGTYKKPKKETSVDKANKPFKK